MWQLVCVFPPHVHSCTAAHMIWPCTHMHLGGVVELVQGGEGPGFESQHPLWGVSTSPATCCCQGVIVCVPWLIRDTGSDHNHWGRRGEGGLLHLPVGAMGKERLSEPVFSAVEGWLGDPVPQGRVTAVLKAE